MSPSNTVARVLERLVIVLSVVIVLMSVMSIVSIFTIREEVRETTRTMSPLNDQSGRLRITIAGAQGSYRAYLLTEESVFRDEYLTARSRFRTDSQVFQRQVDDAHMDARRTDAFLAAADEWFRLADEQLATRSEASLARSAPAFATVEREHDALATEIADVRQERRDRYNLFMNGAIALMGLASLVAIFVTVSQARRALNRLARPLRALQQVVSRQGGGAALERADVSEGADEVIALASAFNALAESNLSMQRERERRLELHRITGSLPTLLAERDGGWDLACERLGLGLDADGTSVYRLEGEDVAALMGSWNSSGGVFPEGMHRLDIPGLGRMLADLPILRASSASEIEDTFPAALRMIAEQRSLQSWVLHPMCFQDDAVGVLSVASSEPHAWDESEISAMERVAEYAAHTLVEQRYVASLEDLDEQKSVFMATTSHELRTPLTSIAGYLELLEDGDYGPLTEPQTRALVVVSRNVQRLRSLIDDLLLLNRLDSGQANTERCVHDVSDSATRVVEELAPVACSAQVELVLERGDGTLVHADQTQLERAIGNLVSNALKFTPAGGHVRLTTSRAGDEVRVRVADTGMGIPEEDQARLFTRFYRASNAQAGEVPGTGLGLVIVKTIAESHQGRVELASVVGEGTTVTLVLPVV
ncbi:ATP-binding protein [Janibacter sp. LM]|uniref:ATP-binding protein n=1 Tax=Janibacter sp. LM TaxID=3144845 RepID=UPI0031F61933